MIPPDEYRFYLASPGPRPPFRLVAEQLWGPNCDFDSDGNSNPFDATDWTELTVISRHAENQRVDVDPLDGVQPGEDRPLVLCIHSEDEDLARRAAEYLLGHCGGALTRTKPVL